MSVPVTLPVITAAGTKRTAPVLSYGARIMTLKWARTADSHVPSQMLVLKDGGTNQYISSTSSFFGARASKVVEVKVKHLQVLMTSLNNVAANLVAAISNCVSSKYHPDPVNIGNNFRTIKPVVIAGSRYGVLTSAIHSNIDAALVVHNFPCTGDTQLKERLEEALTQYDYKSTNVNGQYELTYSTSELIPPKICRPYSKVATLDDLRPAKTVIVHCSWKGDRTEPWDIPVELRTTFTNATGVLETQVDTRSFTFEEKIAIIPLDLRYAHGYHGTANMKSPNFIFIMPPWVEPITFHNDCYIRVIATIKRRNMTIVVTAPLDANTVLNVEVDQRINNLISNDVETLNILVSQAQPQQSHAERGDGYKGNGQDSDHQYDQLIKDTISKILRDAGVADNKIAQIVSDDHMEIWRSAYTHSQYVELNGGNTLLESYERMEFFGDAVVDMLLKSWLMQHHTLSENPMTEIAHGYLSKNTMPVFTRKLGLQKLIRTHDGKTTTAMEEDVFESTMGALYTVVQRASGNIGPALEICQRVFLLIVKPLEEDISKWAHIPYFTALDQRLNRLGWRVKKFQSVVVRPHVVEGQQLYAMFAANQTLATKFVEHRIISSIHEPLVFHKSVNATDIKEVLSKLMLEKLDRAGLTDEVSHRTSLDIFVTRYQGGRPDLVRSIMNRVGEFNARLNTKQFVTVKVRTIKNTKTTDYETAELRLEDLHPVETSHKTVLICTYSVAEKDKAKYMMLEHFVTMPLETPLPQSLTM